MTIFDGVRELMDVPVTVVLLLDLVFFSYLAFRLSRERDLFGPARGISCSRQRPSG